MQQHQDFRGLLEQSKVGTDQLAKDLGVTNSEVEGWINGDQSPPEQYREQIAQRFGVPQDSISWGNTSKTGY